MRWGDKHHSLPDDAAERRLSPLRVSAMSSTFSFLSTSTVASFLPQYSKNLQDITCEFIILVRRFKARRSRLCRSQCSKVNGKVRINWVERSYSLHNALMLLTTTHEVYFFTKLIKGRDLKKLNLILNLLVNMFRNNSNLFQFSSKHSMSGLPIKIKRAWARVMATLNLWKKKSKKVTELNQLCVHPGD